MGNSNNGRNQVEFQSFDDRNDFFNNGTGIYINEAEIVVANIRARSLRGDEQVYTISVKDVRSLRLDNWIRNQTTNLLLELKSSVSLLGVAYHRLSFRTTCSHLIASSRIFCESRRLKTTFKVNSL